MGALRGSRKTAKQADDPAAMVADSPAEEPRQQSESNTQNVNHNAETASIVDGTPTTTTATTNPIEEQATTTASDATVPPGPSALGAIEASEVWRQLEFVDPLPQQLRDTVVSQSYCIFREYYIIISSHLVYSILNCGVKV